MHERLIAEQHYRSVLPAWGLLTRLAFETEYVGIR